MFVGIDLGTSGVKSLLVDDSQTVIATASAELAVSRPAPGHSEQNPNDWIDAVRASLNKLRQLHDLSSVSSIGLSGQMHGATLLDHTDAPLRPCILWNDTRAHQEAAELDANRAFRDLTGNIVFPGFTAPKLLWVYRHQAEVFRRTKKVLLPKDFVRLWLTGEHVTDMSDAAGTAWLDVKNRDWSNTLLAHTNMTRDQMPRLIEGSELSGQVRADIADMFGLPKTTCVAGGGGDNAASALGVGATRPGTGFISLGTSGVLFVSTDTFNPAPQTALHTFCHAVPKTWHQMGVILAATDALNWYAQLVGSSSQALANGLGTLTQPGRAMFLPYLGGERTPHNDARVRAALVGLDHGTDQIAGTRAVLEGVAFAFRDCFDAMNATDAAPTRLLAVGGGARSDYWLRLLATVLNTPIDRPTQGDFGGAFGASRLAMMAVGALAPDALMPPPIEQSFDPEPTLIDAYDAAHTRYTATYSALKELS